jgi:hypothetical protein
MLFSLIHANSVDTNPCLPQRAVRLSGNAELSKRAY